MNNNYLYNVYTNDKRLKKIVDNVRYVQIDNLITTYLKLKEYIIDITIDTDKNIATCELYEIIDISFYNEDYMYFNEDYEKIKTRKINIDAKKLKIKN